MTLIELVVVVAILVILAGLVLMRTGDVEVAARSDAARASMAVIRSAIVGPPEQPGFKDDVGQLPNSLADLLRQPSVPFYDPVLKRGWNGPYLLVATGTYPRNDGHGFDGDHGVPGEPTMVDSWGHPIVIQAPNEEFARLVSAGPDGFVDTNPAQLAPDIHNPSDVGDDVVLYLSRANGPSN